MSLYKIWLIARREYLYNIRRRSYLFTAFVVPILSIGLSLVASNFSFSQLDDTGSYKRVGIVDQANIMGVIKLPAPYEIIDTPEKAAAQLKDKTLDLYFLLPLNYLSTGTIESYSRASIAPGLDTQFGKLVRKALAAKAGKPDVIARLQDPIPTLNIRKPDSSQIYDESVLISAIIAPMLFGLLLFLSIMTTSQFLMSGVVEEKENRMMELLATSSRPSEMLWGKIIGLGGLGLTQILIWGVMGLGYAALQGTANIGSTLANLQITPGSLLMLVAYFLLGYLLYGAIMAGIGSTVNAEQESRQIASIISMLAILPFFFIISFLSDPNGPLATGLSLFPVTAPVAMTMRAAFTVVSPWQIGLSLCLMLISVIVVVWIAARVFRLGMLSYGKRLGIRDILRAFREGRHVLTTTSGTPKEAKAI